MDYNEFKKEVEKYKAWAETVAEELKIPLMGMLTYREYAELHGRNPAEMENVERRDSK